MSQYTNPADITSGRRMHIGFPMDDRIVFVDLADILNDLETLINGGNQREVAWYDGLVAYVKSEHRFYTWLNANAANPNVNYSSNLMPNNHIYVTLPNDPRSNQEYNWYPVGGGGSGGDCCTFENNKPVSATNLEGYPEGSSPGGPYDIQQMWDTLLYPYVPPLISLNGSPSPGYREKGIILQQVNLIATTTKKKDPITEVTFFRDGNLINTNNNPNSNGGTEVYLDLVDVGPSNDVFYQAKVYDGTSLVSSNTIWYRLVYPFYIGNTSTNTPDDTIVQSFDKIITPKQNQQYEFNFTQQRYVIAYPDAYGPLKHIYDTNGFETIDDYTLRFDTYVMLDGESVDYRLYVFNFLTDASNFINYFEF